MHNKAFAINSRQVWPDAVAGPRELQRDLEFQEQLILPYTQIAGAGWLSAIGLNATAEAVSAQALVIALAVASFVVLQWRARHAVASPNSQARAQ